MFRLLKDDTGLGTIEIVILLAILVGLALIFKEKIIVWAERMIDGIVENDFVGNSGIMLNGFSHVFY